MGRKLWRPALIGMWAAAGWLAVADDNAAVSLLRGRVTDESGKPLPGATLTAIDPELQMTISVYSHPDGSFELDGIPPNAAQLRARLLGLQDQVIDLQNVSGPVELKLTAASGVDLQLQRPAVDRLGLLQWDNEADALNFKMMCAYCHQVGTQGFRTPEEPVDWEVMVTRMDGFGGLFRHTQETLVGRLIETYGPEAEAKWPEWKPWAAPSEDATRARVTEWSMGKKDDAMIHDLEVGKDGRVYVVDMTNDAVISLNPSTGERVVHSIPGGKQFDSEDVPIKGPHSIEGDAEGNMWITLALSGQMAKFDVKTFEWTVVSGHEAPRPRGGYPHTLRVDQKGRVWYTDAGMGVFVLDPAEDNKVKFYRLPAANQVRGGGRGESRGVTPYGLDVAPDGKIWYTKLNGQRVGRIDPELPDDHPDKIVEWQPPVFGPRRLEVGPDGKVWIPGWASGNFCSFDPVTEEWKVYDLPHGPDSLPYALGVNRQTGEVWICGTGTDSMIRFNPKSDELTEYRMPSRVTYTREVEFDAQGNVWVCNSNYPVRHVENGHGSIIKIEVK